MQEVQTGGSVTGPAAEGEPRVVDGPCGGQRPERTEVALPGRGNFNAE